MLPGFVFLAGTSAFLYGRRHPDLARFLATRGAWLIILELTFLRWAWTFNFDFAHEMAGVIWVIGWCMILLALLIRLPVAAVGAVGVVIMAGHNLLDPLLPTLAERPFGWLWTILYVGPFAGPIALGAEGPWLVVLYSIIPWIGVMAAGYAFGTVIIAEPARRRRLCLQLGLGAIALFLVLRGFNLYGNPQPWTTGGGDGDGPAMPALLSFLNTTKYPASLDFLLMTLGPVIALHSAPRRGARPARTIPHGLRSRPVLLLPAAHPSHPRPRPGGLEDSPRRGEPLALHQSPHGKSPGTRGIHLEPAAPVPGLGRIPRFALPTVPLVR